MSASAGPRGRTVDRVVELPARAGGTLCHVRVCASGVGTVVIVSELAHNPGLSIERNFGRVAERVRRWVPADCEPVWLEHWPARALAVWVLHDAVAPSTHLRRPVSGAWSRSPLSPQALEQLLKHSAAAD